MKRERFVTRESDERTKNIHPTFKTKPLPILQAVAQGGKFYDSKVFTIEAEADLLKRDVQLIPSNQDTYYDPSHPDADWAGLVSKSNVTQKRHSQDHRSQQTGIRMEEGGIVSVEERKELGRKPGSLEAKEHNNGSIVISGINCDSERWKTSYKSFEQQEGTAKDQLILVKRAGTRKAIPDPAQARSHNGSATAASASPRTWDSQQQQQQQQQLIAPAPSMRGRSFLANLGASIAPRLPDSRSAIGPTATAVDARSMLSANYNPYPGFTGKKKY